MEFVSIQPLPSQNSGYSVPTPPAASRGDATFLPKSETVQQIPNAPGSDNDVSAGLSDEKRQELVQRAAQEFNGLNAGITFAIYKDASGKYITRYTNLRDGKITYTPEVDALAFLGNRIANQKALLSVQA